MKVGREEEEEEKKKGKSKEERFRKERWEGGKEGGLG
jgi:hypothetical protein